MSASPRLIGAARVWPTTSPGPATAWSGTALGWQAGAAQVVTCEHGAAGQVAVSRPHLDGVRWWRGGALESGEHRAGGGERSEWAPVQQHPTVGTTEWTGQRAQGVHAARR